MGLFDSFKTRFSLFNQWPALSERLNDRIIYLLWVLKSYLFSLQVDEI